MIARAAAGAVLLLTGSCLPAAADDGLFQRETLTGDWWGLRPALAGSGIQLGGDEIVDAQANPAGGNKQGAAFEGRLEIFANADLQTLLGWPGAIAHINAYQIHGHGLSADDVGNLLTTGNIGATPATRLFGLWLQQSFFDDQVSVRAGQIAADDEFFVSQYAALFINSAFGWPSILGINLPSGGPAYPLATPGVRVRVALSPEWMVTTAVLNGNPAPEGPGDPQRRDGDGLRFRVPGSALWIGEVAYGDSTAALPGSYKLGGWYHNGDFADQRLDTAGGLLAESGGDALIHHGNFGGYVIVDQALWRGDGNQGLAAFFRAGAAPDDRNLIAFHVDAGFNYSGLLPWRQNDLVGLALSYDRVGDRRRAFVGDLATMDGLCLPGADFESALELSYQAQLAPWWVVQPDAQLILHPGARLADPAAPSITAPGNAVILGLRTAVSF